MGHKIGGPGKVSVIASGLFGSISGSAIANTVSTGTFTIPMMKKAGFRPHIAGGIEPAASIGGMFMPPIMGAGAFIMAELTQTPYLKIAVAAFMKKTRLCRNGWLADELVMGTESSVARYVSEFFRGKRIAARAAFDVLTTEVLD